MNDREKLQAQERDLAGQRHRQADFLGFCEAVPMADPDARDSLVREQRRKLREIEERLSAVRMALERAPALTAPASPTPG